MAGSKSSNRGTDGQLVTGSGVITGFMLKAGSDAASAIVYDNTEASGDILIDCAAVTNTSFGLGGLSKAFSRGCYLDINGTSPSFTIDTE